MILVSFFRSQGKTSLYQTKLQKLPSGNGLFDGFWGFSVCFSFCGLRLRLVCGFSITTKHVHVLFFRKNLRNIVIAYNIILNISIPVRKDTLEKLFFFLSGSGGPTTKKTLFCASSLIYSYLSPSFSNISKHTIHIYVHCTYSI